MRALLVVSFDWANYRSLAETLTIRERLTATHSPIEIASNFQSCKKLRWQLFNKGQLQPEFTSFSYATLYHNAPSRYLRKEFGDYQLQSAATRLTNTVFFIQ